MAIHLLDDSINYPSTSVNIKLEILFWTENVAPSERIKTVFVVNKLIFITWTAFVLLEILLSTR